MQHVVKLYVLYYSKEGSYVLVAGSHTREEIDVLGECDDERAFVDMQ